HFAQDHGQRSAVTLGADYFLLKSFQHMPLGEPASPSFARYGLPQQVHQSADLTTGVLQGVAGFLAAPLHLAELGRLSEHDGQHRGMTPSHLTRKPVMRPLPQGTSQRLRFAIGQEQHRRPPLARQPRQIILDATAVQTAIQQQSVARIQMEHEPCSLQAVHLDNLPGAQRLRLKQLTKVGAFPAFRCQQHAPTLGGFGHGWVSLFRFRCCRVVPLYSNSTSKRSISRSLRIFFNSPRSYKPDFRQNKSITWNRFKSSRERESYKYQRPPFDGWCDSHQPSNGGRSSFSLEFLLILFRQVASHL